MLNRAISMLEKINRETGNINNPWLEDLAPIWGQNTETIIALATYEWKQLLISFKQLLVLPTQVYESH